MTAAIDGISAGRAWERIGGDGVFALVPRADGRFGVICCASAGRIDRLCALPDDALCARLQARFVGASLRRFARALRLSVAPANERAAGGRARFFGRARRRRLAPDRRVGIELGLGRRGGFGSAARAIFRKQRIDRINRARIPPRAPLPPSRRHRRDQRARVGGRAPLNRNRRAANQ